MVRTAVIMAAGRGVRFGSRTTYMPKGFIPFNGKAMVVRSMENLLAAGIERVIIGTGYHSEWYDRLQQEYPNIETVFSPDFAVSNSMETLWRCQQAVGGESFLLLESDIVYEPRALSALIECSCTDVMLVADVTKFQDQYYIAADECGNLAGCSTDKSALGIEPYGELVGIHKLSPKFYEAMCNDYACHRQEYIKRGYEYEIEDIATGRNIDVASGAVNHIDMQVLKVPELKWYEIDDDSDLEYAEKHINL